MSTLDEHEQPLAPAAAPPRASTAGDDARAANTDGNCRRCGYPLVGLDDRVACPECGLLVGFSRLRSDELRHAHRGWLLRLSMGASLTAVAMLAAPIFVGIAGEALAEARLGDADDAAVSSALGLAVLTVLSAGIFVLTSGRHIGSVRPSRRVVRLALLLLLLIYSLTAGLGVALAAVGEWAPVDLSSSTFAEWFGLAMVVGTPLAAMPLAVLGFRYLRHLAARAPAPLLAGDSAAYGYVLATILTSPILLWLVALVFDALRPRWNGVGSVIVLTILISAAVGYCWGAYLLIRYAIAFLWARRQAAKLMRQFDASLDPRVVAYDPPS